MLSRRLLLALAPLLLPTPVLAQDLAIDLDEARRAFEAARRVSEEDAGRLWGTALYGPIFLVDRATRSVAADRADTEGVLTERDGVWIGTFPETLIVANSAIEWAGWPP